MVVMKASKVKGILVTANGGPDVLKYQDIEIMAPGPGQAFVKIAACGVNFIDIYQRIGRYTVPLPYTPGLEGAGVVEAVGEGVDCVKVGDRVAYSSTLGAYAEAALVTASELIPLPDAISFEEGAAFPLQGMTAHYLINDFRKIKGTDTVLVHAAAGGMGQLLVQWLKHLKATVIGTVSTSAKAEIAKACGADHVIDYSTSDFVEEVHKLTGGKGCEMVIDGVGKTTFAGSLEAVASHGHVVLFGSASGPAEPIAPNSLQQRSITISGGSLFNHINDRDELLMRANDVLHAIKVGWLKLNIEEVIKLADASKAHELLESRKSTGKIILSTTK
ncbi:quinone oxidoreductase [soil metagenome]